MPVLTLAICLAIFAAALLLAFGVGLIELKLRGRDGDRARERRLAGEGASPAESRIDAVLNRVPKFEARNLPRGVRPS